MLTCPKCGAKARAGSQTCAFCDASLFADPTPPSAPSNRGDRPGTPSPLAQLFQADLPGAAPGAGPPAAPSAGPPAAPSGGFAISRWIWMIGGPIVAVILVVVVVVYLHRPSLTGEWYGPISVTAVALTVPDGEVYLKLQQGGDGSITGSGAACLFTTSASADFDVSGRVVNGSVTLALGFTGQPDTPDQNLAGQYTGTWSGQSLQLTTVLASGSGAITLRISAGSRANYDAACQNPAAAS